MEKRYGRTALVLEGGGMRGVYTTGALDCFIDHGIFFDYVIGVSAGATHALSYISRQKDRARRVNVDYCKRPDYMGLRCLLTEGSLFGMKLIFETIPNVSDPFDFDAFRANRGSYRAAVTNVRTGEAEYLDADTKDDLMRLAMATCSLPYVSPPVTIGGESYLDGGIADSIPVGKALADGALNAIVVLTQPAGYRKRVKPALRASNASTASRALSVARAFYPRNREFARLLATRNERYNESLALVERLESEGRALALRPRPQPGLRRLERDPARLNALHESGYADCLASLDRIREFSR
jgi:predicted patatin/cPLA2 family phospholipase